MGEVNHAPPGAPRHLLIRVAQRLRSSRLSGMASQVEIEIAAKAMMISASASVPSPGLPPAEFLSHRREGDAMPRPGVRR
jgi:hypothetical protein